MQQIRTIQRGSYSGLVPMAFRQASRMIQPNALSGAGFSPSDPLDSLYPFVKSEPIFFLPAAQMGVFLPETNAFPASR